MMRSRGTPAGRESALEVPQSAWRHKARQVRARVVELAQEYRIACDRYDAEGMAVEQGEGDLAAMEDAGNAMDAARAALFAALGELEMLEEEGP